VADHGHRLPSTGKRVNDFKIPLLWLGGALREKMTIAATASQADIASTLLAQLGMNHSEFKWSRNITDSLFRPAAYFSFNNGFGWVEPDKYYLFDNVGKRKIEQEGTIGNNELNFGKAMQQLTVQDYIDR
jgi:hypothetical protein